MMPNLQYRPMREGDVAAIARVHHRACLIAYRFMNWSYSEVDVRDWYAGKFPGWDWGLVAEERNAVVGFAAAQGIHLDQLFVDPDHQRLGIGTDLLTAALQRTPPVLTLDVFEENRLARRFYERHGFREVSRYLNQQEAAMELLYCRGVTSAECPVLFVFYPGGRPAAGCSERAHRGAVVVSSDLAHWEVVRFGRSRGPLHEQRRWRYLRFPSGGKSHGAWRRCT